MGRANRSRQLATLLLAAQFGLGYAGWFTRAHEIFPLTAWYMFALVPNKLTDYDVLIYGTAKQPQEPPTTFSQSGNRVHTPHSVTTYQIVQQLGAAVEKKDAARIVYLRPQLEEQFNAPHMRYELLKETYMPVARWKAGQLLSCRGIGSFIATEPPLKKSGQPPPLEQGTASMRPPDDLPIHS